MRNFFPKIMIILSVCFACVFTPFTANASDNYNEELRGLYEKAVELYEKYESENAHLVQINDITMGYLDFGPKNNTPLIWAHGSGWTSYEILNVKDGLIASGYRVIAIDYRGHGKTQITDFNTSLYDVADDIAVLMDHLYISKAVIGGWSKGGFVAAAFYDEYPDRVLGLLLEDGGSWSDQKSRDENLDLKKELESMQSWAQFHNKQFATRFEAFKASIGVAAPSQVSLSIAVGMLSKFLIDDHGRWGSHLDPNLMIGDPSSFEKNTPSLHPLMQWNQQAMIPEIIFRNLDVPMTIVDPVSEDDFVAVTHQNRNLKKQHPNLITHEIYENTGHAAHLTRPKLFIDDAKSLLQKVQVRNTD